MTDEEMKKFEKFLIEHGEDILKLWKLENDKKDFSKDDCSFIFIDDYVFKKEWNIDQKQN